MGTIAHRLIVLVGFWTVECCPCRSFALTFTAAFEKHPAITSTEVDTKAERELTEAAGIRSIPTLMAFRDYVFVFAPPGSLNAVSLEQLILSIETLVKDDVCASIAARQAASRQDPRL